jgi:hypothetical protein
MLPNDRLRPKGEHLRQGFVHDLDGTCAIQQQQAIIQTIKQCLQQIAVLLKLASLGNLGKLLTSLVQFRFAGSETAG